MPKTVFSLGTTKYSFCLVAESNLMNSGKHLVSDDSQMMFENEFEVCTIHINL